MTEQSFSISRFVPFAIIAGWFICYLIINPFYYGVSFRDTVGTAAVTGPQFFLFAGGWWYANNYIEQKKQEKANKKNL